MNIQSHTCVRVPNHDFSFPGKWKLKRNPTVLTPIPTIFQCRHHMPTTTFLHSATTHPCITVYHGQTTGTRIAWVDYRTKTTLFVLRMSLTARTIIRRRPVDDTCTRTRTTRRDPVVFRHRRRIIRTSTTVSKNTNRIRAPVARSLCRRTISRTRTKGNACSQEAAFGVAFYLTITL